MELETLKNKGDRKKRSLSEGMSTKEEDTDEQRDHAELDHADPNEIENFQDAQSHSKQSLNNQQILIQKRTHID